MASKKNDDFMTPDYVWEEISEIINKYIPEDKSISLPFYGDGRAGIRLGKYINHNIIHQREDYFEMDRGDFIVDNIPFSIKRRVFEVARERNKPFMFLAPASTLCYQYFKKIFKSGEIQMIIPSSRYKFIGYDKKNDVLDENWKKKTPSFDTVWFCYKMNIDNDITFLRK
jgi:hypothetical protein